MSTECENGEYHLEVTTYDDGSRFFYISLDNGIVIGISPDEQQVHSLINGHAVVRGVVGKLTGLGKSMLS